MRRSLWILIGMALTTAVAATVAYKLAGCVCAAQVARPTDELEWLRLEFGLADAELARIRDLHNGYRPECERYCADIAVRKRALSDSLESGAAVTPQVEQQLAGIAAVRAQCQSAMLRHFEAVSRLMPAEQGRRYLAVMREVTLGRHDEVEARMAGSPENPHHGHQHR